jgi:hypothetical protein
MLHTEIETEHLGKSKTLIFAPGFTVTKNPT